MILNNKLATLITLLLGSVGVHGQCTEKICRSRNKVFEISKNLDEYYSLLAGAAGTSASDDGADNKVGAELKATLNSIIKDHERYTYDCVWEALADIDAVRDSNGQKTDQVFAIYTQRPIDTLDRVCGGNNSLDAWNREHLWPKSHGFKSSSAHAHTDFHHLTPADVSTNSNRGNTDFKDGGENNVCSSKDKTCCVDCKKDGNLTWEPPKVAKGQIARMMFYMDVRYEGNDQGRTRTPDLVLVDELTKVGDPELGYLSDLLKWHCENPVTDLEKRRNDLVQTWQGNRNPFIDRPDLVKAVWNDPKYDSIWENCNENPADVGSNSEDDAQDGSNNDENPADVDSNSEDDAQDGSNNDENPADVGSNSEDDAQDGSNNDENPADVDSNSEDSVNIVISSALINPSGFNEKGREWVEIKNLGKGNVDLAGWKLSDRKRRGTPITLSGILIPNATKRITELIDENGSVILTNGSGGLFLEDSNGKLIDSSEWNQRPRDDEVLEFI